MDKYLVPIDKTKKTSDLTCRKDKRFKQLTIQNLKGIVNVDEILRIKSLLKVPNQSHDVLSKCLNTLSDKIPSIEVLKSTKIAKTVKTLTKHGDGIIREKANELVDAWSHFYIEKLKRPKVDVLCDHETSAARQNSIKQIMQALVDKDPSIRELSEVIEREVFIRHRMIRKSYSLLMRSIIHHLQKDKDNLRSKLLQNEITADALVAKLDVFKKS